MSLFTKTRTLRERLMKAIAEREAARERVLLLEQAVRNRDAAIDDHLTHIADLEFQVRDLSKEAPATAFGG